MGFWKGSTLSFAFICFLFAKTVDAQEKMSRYSTVEALQARVIELLLDEPLVNSAKAAEEEGLIVWTSNAPFAKGIEVTTYVGNLFVQIGELDDENEVESAIQYFVSVGISSLKPMAVNQEKLYANIRPKTWLGNGSIESSGIAARELTDELVILLQQDNTGGYSSIDFETIGGLANFEKYLSIAKNNNEKLLDQLGSMPREKYTVYFLEDNSALAAALLLTEGFKTILADSNPEGSIVVLPNNEDVVVFDKREPDAVALAKTIVAEFNKEVSQAISKNIFEFNNGQLKEINEIAE